jgi:hypothetical protein
MNNQEGRERRGIRWFAATKPPACSIGGWLMAGADFSDRKVLLAGCWWLIC